MSKVLILNSDYVGELMAGPAIRYCEMARVLSRYHQVTLGIPNDYELEIPDVDVRTYGKDNIEDLIDKNDIIMVSGFLLTSFPMIADAGKPIVVDVYDPFVLESLQLKSRHKMYDLDTKVQNDLLRVGDFFICASEKQRDFWLGMLAALHRINPSVYLEDETLRGLIDVVSFGIPSKSPDHTKQVLKGVHPGIKKSDKLVIWGGGVYDWLDPISLIKAMAEIYKERDDIKLFFMGTKHPNPTISKMKMCDEAIELSQELGLSGKVVFFNDWVAYKERANYLLEADIGISLHLEHIETSFSFRTRMLDYVWASLPMISTKGDAFAELIDQHGLGMIVDYQAIDQISKAIVTMIDDPPGLKDYSDNMLKVQDQLTWDRIVKPLLKFCKNPRIHRPDLADEEIEDLKISVKSLGQAVKEKNNHIKNIEKLVVDKDRHIENLESQISEYEKGLFYKIVNRFRQMGRNT